VKEKSQKFSLRKYFVSTARNLTQEHFSEDAFGT